MATDRTTLRRTIGDRLGDMIVLTATHVSGSADTFRDVVNLGDRGDNAPSVVNKIAYISGGTAANLGHEARISAFQGETRILTFDPDAATAPQVGDTLELWNVTERIGSIQTLHRLLNAGIRAVRNEVSAETWDTAQTFQARSPYLTIPATWVEFGGVDWTDGRGYLHEIPPDKLRVRPGARTVEIIGRPAWRANNRSLQLWGYDVASEMTTDASTTSVDPEWLVESVLSWVALAASSRASDVRGPSEERRANFWSAQAMAYRRNVGAPRRGLGISL